MPEVFIDMHTLAELIGVSHDTARRFRYGKGKGPDWRKPTGFPKPWGEIQRPGAAGRGSAVFPLSEVLDWLAEHRAYDLRIALEFGNIGQELGRLQEREAWRDRKPQSLSPKASRDST